MDDTGSRLIVGKDPRKGSVLTVGIKGKVAVATDKVLGQVQHL